MDVGIYREFVSYHKFLCASSRKGCTGLSDVGMVISAGDCIPFGALISCPIFTLLAACVAKISQQIDPETVPSRICYRYLPWMNSNVQINLPPYDIGVIIMKLKKMQKVNQVR